MEFNTSFSTYNAKHFLKKDNVFMYKTVLFQHMQPQT